MNVAVFSDLHAGRNVPEADERRAVKNAIARAAEFADAHEVGEIVLNGDTVHHLENGLAHETDPDLGVEQLRPLVDLLHSMRGQLRMTIVSGNTDGLLAEQPPHGWEPFFRHSGLTPDDVHVPTGGLLYERKRPDGQTNDMFTHGHALTTRARESITMDEDIFRLAVRFGNKRLLQEINETHGTHRRNFLIVQSLHTVLAVMPPLRRLVFDVLGDTFDEMHRMQYGKLLEEIDAAYGQKRDRIGHAFMGHTHVPGIHQEKFYAVINTGTTGGMVRPGDRASDRFAHAAILNDETGVTTLYRTWSRTHQDMRPERIAIARDQDDIGI